MSTGLNFGWLLLLLLFSIPPALALTADEKLLQAEALRTHDPSKVRQLLLEIEPELDRLEKNSRLRYLQLKAHNLAIFLDFTSAISLLDKIEASADANNKVKALVLRSDIEANRSNYHQSLQALRQAINILADVTDNEARFRVYDLAATLMAENGSYEQAQDYVAEAFTLAKLSGQPKWQCHALYTMSLINKLLSKHEALRQSAREQQQTCQHVDNMQYCDALESLAVAHQQLGQAAVANDYFNQGIACYQENSWQPGTASIKVNYASYLLTQGDTKKAAAMLADAEPILNQADITKPLATAYSLLAEIAEQENRLSAALTYYRRHMQLERQLLDNKRQRELIFNQVKFEVERNKQEELRLQRENQLLAQQAEEENRRRQLMSGALIISAALSVLLLLTLHRLHRQRGQLRYLAESDTLTGCYSRHHAMQLADKLHASCARRKAPMAVLMVDLDHFKSINDRFGHPAGDAVLHAAGRALAKQLRQQDVIGRYGGEEFLILLPDSERHSAETVVNRCRLALDRLIMNSPQRLPTITASIGVALCPDSSTTLSELIQIADDALYRAKDSGRDCAEYSSTVDPQHAASGS